MRRVAFLGGLLLIAGVRAAHAEQMPQLDFGNPLLLAQVVWLGIIFVALYLLLGRWALPQLAEVLRLRADTIAADLDKARSAKAQADAAVAELTEATRQAQARAQAEINEAVAAARLRQAEQAATLGAELDRQLAEAEQRIAAARQSAMGALRDVAGQAAGALVTRLTGRSPDPSSLDRAVADALTARG
jgi:F-type H+-transporting ATPase subunit b